MTTSVRRSRRERKYNSRYMNSGWEHNTLDSVQPSSENSNHDSVDEFQNESLSSSDEIFVSDEVQMNTDLPNEVEGKEGRPSPANGADTDASLSSDSDIEDSDRNVSAALTKTAKRSKRISGHPLKLGPQAIGARSRGIRQIQRKGAKDVVYTQIFGPGLEDLRPVLHARDTWLTARDITLPSRRTLGSISAFKPVPAGNSSSRLSGQALDSTPKMHQNVHASLQDTQSVEQQFAKQTIVIGPWGEQQELEIQYHKPLPMGKAWQSRQNESIQKPTLQKGHQASEVRLSIHEAWLLNLGARVQSLAWLPSSSNSQCLAISCRSSSDSRPAGSIPGQAFQPSSKYTSHIELWMFSSKQVKRSLLRTLDMSVAPELLLRIETFYGDTRDIRWQPSRDSDSNLPSIQTENADELGCLAILSTDGHVRLAMISVSAESIQQGISQSCEELLVADISLPMPSIYTSMAWLSHNDLLLGCSTGCVRIFSISSSSELQKQPEPYYTWQLHNTFILTLCPALPLTSSFTIASSTTSGDILLTDLRSPDQDRVHLQKARLPTKGLTYAPFTRSFITTMEHSGLSEPKGKSQTSVICHHVRHFYSGVHVSKLPEMSGGATALASSSHHPCLLVGNAEGTVFATNYLRKILPSAHPSKVHKQKLGAYLQKVCEYEWRPHHDNTSLTNSNTVYHGKDLRPGVSRFQEGFMAEKIDLTPGGPPRRKRKIADEDATAAEIIFEEEQAVTVLEWNPNPVCSGLIAMGWGSGILRVQDLSHEAE